jgi:hypothetical protein
MRTFYLAAVLTFIAAVPTAAQQSRTPNTFNFDVCYNRCLNLGSSPGSCAPGCAERAAQLARIPAGAPRGSNDDPRSPRFYDLPPRAPAW